MGISWETFKTIFTKRINALLIGVLLLFIFSCDNPSQSIPEVSEEGDPKGVVSISIPAYASWMEDIFSAYSGTSSSSRSLSDADSRAFAVAGRVVLTVKDASLAQVATAEFTPGSFADEGLTLSIDVPVGTGYTLDVEIFNTFESETEPTVTGTSDSFDISDGQTTEITVTCVPASPTELTLGAAATSFTQTNYVIASDSSITATGGETWISFNAPANGSVMFTTDIPDTLAIGIALYDAQGLPASDLNSRETDGSLYFTGLTGSAEYYGLVILADQNTSTQAEQSFTLAADVAYTISGTVTVPGIIDEALLPGGGEFGSIFLIPTLTTVNPPTEDNMVSVIFLDNPVVAGGNLEYSYTLGYDGDETAVLASGIIANTENWPAEGDYFGVAPNNVGTDMDLLNMTGIETYTFSGDLTGVDFELQLLEAEVPSGTVNVIIN